MQPSGSTPVIGTGSIAQKGKFSNALSVKTKKPSTWIIDSGASDHMTGDPSLFQSYYPCSENYKVHIANGSLSSVTGIGSIIISQDLILKSVLLVPNLTCNLLSISKLIKDRTCVTKFYPSHCQFQDLDSGKTIGNVEECAGLYLFKVESILEKHARCVSVPAKVGQSIRDLFSVSESNNNNCAIMLWHYRLGHPSFVYLSKLFPSLFRNKKPSLFQCEICQLSRHVRNSFPAHDYKASHPFHMIHNDIWGPSRITNISGKRWFVSFIDDHTRTTWIFLMKEKSEVGPIIKNFHSMIQNQFQANVQKIISDNAKDYFNTILGEYVRILGV